MGLILLRWMRKNANALHSLYFYFFFLSLFLPPNAREMVAVYNMVVVVLLRRWVPIQ